MQLDLCQGFCWINNGESVLDIARCNCDIILLIFREEFDERGRIEMAYNILIHVVNLRKPEQRCKLPYRPPRSEMLAINNVVDVEDTGLDDYLQLATDKGVSVVDDVVGANASSEIEAVRISGLEADRVCFFLRGFPLRMRVMPDVFDDAEQNGVQEFDWCVLRWIEAWCSMSTPQHRGN